MLIDAKAEVNTKTVRGWTALIFAAAFGQEESLKELIAHKADVNVQTLDGQTALTFAEKKKKDTIVKILREAGAK